MLPLAPYNTWPLHVKIFTEEAKKLWDQVQQPGLDTPLPRGFTYTVEYEGVDGKASIPRSEKQPVRTGPIDVKDAKFTLSHIEKYQSVVDRGDQITCSLCVGDLNAKRIDHLAIALCPHPTCLAMTHLTCLAQSFRDRNSPLVPRGGICKTCNKYVLWGDVIRGCYRRARGGLEKPASEQEDEEASEATDDELARHLDDLQVTQQSRVQPKPADQAAATTKPVKPSKTIKQMKPKTASKPQPNRIALRAIRNDPSSDVEDFGAEMDAIQCDTEDENTAPLDPIAPRNKTRAPKSQSTGSKKLTAIGKKVQVRAAKGTTEDPALTELHQALGGLSLSSNPSTKPRKATGSRSKPPLDATTRSTKAKVKKVDFFDDEPLACNPAARPASNNPSAHARSPSPEYIDIWAV
ncbi:structure-specific endonuclease subunit SLX1 [Ceratobasidium sp. AG-Ba]|nr:structure-specific endonuclease subunit SLX1 [Ceratobasidium sp. AG-Ba]QRW13491.1 structure-specific endonuclease subunit SLX1 [Ceratobasidium sp. AG-Ba]